MIAKVTLLSSIVARWRGGEPADAQAELAKHPELNRSKSLVLSLAYEEYCQRKSSGEEVDADQFCGRFSRCQHSLFRRIEMHELLEGQSSLLGIETDTSWPDIGDYFIDCKLVDELGRGAIGRVFLADQDGMIKRRVVVKVSPSGRREAQTLVKLQHDNIVPVLEVKQDSERELFGVVMPFLGRTTLSDFLDAVVAENRPTRFADVLRKLHGEYPREELADAEKDLRKLNGLSYVEGVVSLARDLAEALAHTHAKEIFHLDLKPSNVLMLPSGRPMLLDFNLSADPGADSVLLGGTLPYMSPEQIRAAVFKSESDREAVDGRSDVFALGVMLYELLSGKHPFEVEWEGGAEIVGQALLDRQSLDAELLSSQCKAIDVHTARVINRCLAPRQQDRYQSAEELAAALGECLSPRRRARRIVRTHRRWFMAAGAAAAMMLAAYSAFALTRPALEDRLLAEGQLLYDAEDYKAARDKFRQAAEIAPTRHDILFWLGRSQLWTFGDPGVSNAMTAFQQAHDIEADGKYSACIAYCQSLQKTHQFAISHYRRALNDGFDSAELRNSFAVSLGNSNYTSEKQDAETQLWLALEMREDLLEARVNLMLIHLRFNGEWDQASRMRAIQNAEIAVELADEVAKVRRVKVAAVYDLAARLWAELGDSDVRQKEAVLANLEQAVQYGQSASEIVADPIFVAFADTPRFRNLSEISPETSFFLIPLVIDPLGEEWRRAPVQAR